jgi:pyrroloquinoline quinone (PQQ) biosynthesis protein C
MLSSGIRQKLEDNPLRKELIHHPFFKEVKTAAGLDREKVGAFLGQWWHPLHYFPHFLARTIDLLPMLGMKTAISKILYQELGEGDPGRAHERLYVSTMQAAGFDEPTVARAAPLPETARLVDGYRDSTKDRLSALGFAYGTEVADLAMVSGIGNAVRRVCGLQDLPWVDIHVLQEPDHVAQVNEAIEPGFTSDDEQAIVAAAEEMWRLWIAFFDRLRQVMFGAEVPAEAVAAGG